MDRQRFLQYFGRSRTCGGQAAGDAAGLWQLRTVGHCAGSGAAGVQLFMDKEWKRITAIILAMLMFQSQYDYVWCLFLIPLFLFMEQERELRSDNVLPYLALMVPVLPLPLFRRDQMEPSFVPRNTICHVMLLLLIVWCFVQTVQGCVYAVRKAGQAGTRTPGSHGVAGRLCGGGRCGRPAAVAAHPQLGL